MPARRNGQLHVNSGRNKRAHTVRLNATPPGVAGPELCGVRDTVIAVAERYPELTADEQFIANGRAVIAGVVDSLGLKGADRSRFSNQLAERRGSPFEIGGFDRRVS